MGYEIKLHKFDSYGNYCGSNTGSGCARCGEMHDLTTVSGPGCWLNFCKICLKEREEIRKVEEKFNKIRQERRG